jgi:hypothetical protein
VELGAGGAHPDHLVPGAVDAGRGDARAVPRRG